MTDTTTPQQSHPSQLVQTALDWVGIAADFGRERAQLLAVDDHGHPTRNARIAEANNQQAHALKLADINAQLATAAALERIAAVAEAWRDFRPVMNLYSGEAVG